MKVKLNNSQMQSLASILQGIIENSAVTPDKFEARLLLCHLTLIFNQLQKKLIDKKKKYTLQMTEPEALTFYVFFSRGIFYLRSDDICETTYKLNLVRSIQDIIYKEFSEN